MKINLIPACDSRSRFNCEKKSPSFKSTLSMDIGGSTNKSSKKKIVKDDFGNIIYYEEGILNGEKNKSYQDANDFKNKIINNFKNDAEYAANYSLTKYGTNDKVKGIALFVPSYIVDEGKLLYLPNMKDVEGYPLKNVDLSDMKTLLANKGVNFVENPNIKILQDANGSGLAIGKSLYEYGLLTPGKKYIVALTGGGCGITTVECNDEGIGIIRSSGSAILASPGELNKISAQGASAKSFTRNFCHYLEIDKVLTEKIVDCGKAIFTSFPQYKPVPGDYRDNELVQLLLKSGKYKEYKNCMNQTCIGLTEENKPLYDSAWKYAYDKYAKALSTLQTRGTMTGYNGLIITGPFADALHRKTNAQLGSHIAKFAHETFKGNDEALAYAKALGFFVKVGEEFGIDNNAPGADIALSEHTKLIDPHNVGAGLKVDYEKICKNVKRVV